MKAKRKSKGRLIAFLLCGIAGLSILLILIFYLISGGFMKKTYLEPWSKSYASQYSDPRISLSAVGLLAANNHNMQPWKIELDKNDASAFYLYADSSRITNKVDPQYRQMMITQGTFLEYLKIAGKKSGWNVAITLFPNGSYEESDILNSMKSKPVAKIILTKAPPAADPLYDAMFLADTNREAYQPDTLTEAQTRSLKSLSADGNTFIKLYTDKQSLSDIGSYAVKSATVEAGVARVMDESNAIFRANEYQKNQFRYGYSVEGQGTTGFMKTVLQGLLTVFPSLNSGKGASENFINYTKASVESTSAYAMIVTATNSRAEQVESGMLYSRLVLTGHTLGLAMQPLSQVLEEYPEMKTLYDEFKQAYAPKDGTVQMLFRVGKPTTDPPVTMRRDVKSLLSENN